jgi:hypothetical protein
MVTMAAPPCPGPRRQQGLDAAERTATSRRSSTEASREARQGGCDVGAASSRRSASTAGDFFGKRISYLLLYFALGSGRFLFRTNQSWSTQFLLLSSQWLRISSISASFGPFSCEQA